MRLFLGTDICEIERISSIYSRYKEKFLHKTFSEAEIKYCLSEPKHTVSRLAVRFATKEAVSKALGVGINSLGWSKGINCKDVELVRNPEGSVELRLYNKAKELEVELGITGWTVSVSHDRHSAVSTVIGY